MGDQCIMFILGPVAYPKNGLTWLDLDPIPTAKL